MSEKIDEFCSILREQLNSVARQLNTAKANIEALRQKIEVAIQAHITAVPLTYGFLNRFPSLAKREAVVPAFRRDA